MKGSKMTTVVGVLTGGIVALAMLTQSMGPTGHVAPPTDFEEVRVVIDSSTEHDEPAVNLYFDDEASELGAERVLKVQGDAWTLRGSELPGLYDVVLAEGAVAADGRLDGLPDDTFEDADEIWMASFAGRTKATLHVDGAPLARVR